MFRPRFRWPAAALPLAGRNPAAGRPAGLRQDRWGQRL